MQDLNDKVTGNNLSADEWNQVPSEIQNVIENLGIALSGADLNQLGKGIAGYVANGTFYTDSGVVDAYVLTKIGLKQVPTERADGHQIRFYASNANTGASTVNDSALGVVDLVQEDGTALTAGFIDVITQTVASFDVGSGKYFVTSAAGTDGAVGTGQLKTVQVITATGLYNKPVGINGVRVQLVGGGGGGGGASQLQTSADGGHSGGYSEEFIDVSAITTVNVTIGAGGNGGAVGNNNGSDGGTTSFGVFCSATGGSGGYSTDNSNANALVRGSPGVGSGGDVNYDGGFGEHAPVNVEGPSGFGGASFFGTGGYGIRTDGTAGIDALIPGAGGGGGYQNITDNAGGDGADGFVIVWEYS